jgi:hypothetical protein
MTAKQRRDSSLKFQPVLNRCDLDSDSGTEARLTFREASVCSSSKLNGCGWFFVSSLRESISSPE